MRDDLSDLIARIEAASGPDRDLDALIHHAVGRRAYVCNCGCAWKYTASLDSALTLVEGWDITISDQRSIAAKYPNARGVAKLQGTDSRQFIYVQAHSMPLALVSAALRARSVT